MIQFETSYTQVLHCVHYEFLPCNMTRAQKVALRISLWRGKDETKYQSAALRKENRIILKFFNKISALIKVKHVK